MVWNGQFEATGMNATTQSSWTSGTPKEVNFLGYQGLETQAKCVNLIDIYPMTELIGEMPLQHLDGQSPALGAYQLLFIVS